MHVFNYPRVTETSKWCYQYTLQQKMRVFFLQHPTNTWYCQIHFYFANQLSMKRISFFKICISLEKCKMVESLFIYLLAIVFPCLVIPLYILCTYFLFSYLSFIIDLQQLFIFSQYFSFVINVENIFSPSMDSTLILFKVYLSCRWFYVKQSY